MVFSGIVLAVMADTGPLTEINLSNLDETSAMKLSISLMTALGLGESQDQLNQLHGSFPVPGKKDLALAFPFTVKSKTSIDPRIQEYGRYCTIFLLFPRENKTSVLNNHALIEKVVSKDLEQIKTQDDLSPDLLKNIYTDLERIIASTEGQSTPTAIKQSISDFVQIQAEQERHQRISGIIREVTQTQTSITTILDELMVFTDPPILEGSFYMRPNIKPEDFLKLLPLVSRFEKILSRLDGEDKETVKEIVDISVLVRIGNLFYWKALSSQQPLEFEKAIEFYLRANQLKDDSILYLTIGSIYRKLNRNEEAKDWIEGGFSRMRKRKESIRISRNILFGDIL